MDYFFPGCEYTITGYIKSKTSIYEKICAMEKLECLMMDTLADFLGGTETPGPVIPVTILANQINTTTPPNFFFDLTPVNPPAFPASMAMYVDKNGTGDFQIVQPVVYDATTKILSQLDNPADYPMEVINLQIGVPNPQPSTSMAKFAMYEIDDGQIRVKTNYRSIAELTKGLDDLRAIKNIYVNQYNGRTMVLQDKRTFR
jgi:hypothetical protein